MANCALICILILYFSMATVFELVEPILSFREVDGHSDRNWNDVFEQAYSLRFFFDFIVCLLILLLMHRFGKTKKERTLSRQSSLHKSGKSNGHVSMDFPPNAVAV